MSKVLVDREMLELLRNFTFLHDDGCAGALRGNIDKALAAQPAEAEGVSNARLMNTLAELARRAPLRTLHTICETQRQVSTVKLERYLEPIGDTLAGYAFTLRIDFDKLSAALSAVTAERDAALAENARLIEDRARFPDKPDDIGNMIRAHIGNLKAGKEQAESYARKWSAEADLLRKDADRWRYVSLQGDDTHWLNLLRVDLEDFGGNINAAVDALIDGEAPATAAKEE